MALPRMLSKSRYLNGLQCPRYIWIQFHEPERIPETDPVTQYIFDQGREVGYLAKKLFPGGIDIPQETFTENVARTKELLEERRSLFEAGILTGNLFSRVDILSPVGEDEWDICEVKSSTSVKDVHINDVAFQRYCCTQFGLNIRNCYLARCTDIRWQIHTEANDRAFHLVFNEIGKEAFTEIGQPFLTSHFGDLAYHLCLLYHRSSGRFGLPDKKLYRVRQRSPIFYELYLGYRRLVTTPGSPHFLPPGAPPPSFPPELLMRWADIHRDMIKEWANSPAIIELQELFESLRGIEQAIKEELGHLS